MAIVQTDIRQTIESARRIRYEPAGLLLATDVQGAIQAIAAAAIPIGTPVNFAMSPYTPVPADVILLVDTSGGAVSIVMPLAAARGELGLEVKDVTGNADPNNITITFTGGQTMDGRSSVVINNPFGFFKMKPKAGGYYETY